jgi:molecular chaperone GrpE
MTDSSTLPRDEPGAADLPSDGTPTGATHERLASSALSTLKDTAAVSAAEVHADDGASRIEQRLEEARNGIAEIRERLAALEAGMEGISKQIALVPPQVRSLGTRLEGLTASITEPRYRALLLGLLAIYDLVDQAARGTGFGGGDVETTDRRNFEVLRTQLSQLFESNGLTEIPGSGPFDPQLHRALQRVVVEDPELAGRILQVVRPGFRSGQTVLRYSEVTVGYCEVPAPEVVDPAAAP